MNDNYDRAREMTIRTFVSLYKDMLINGYTAEVKGPENDICSVEVFDSNGRKVRTYWLGPDRAVDITWD